MEPNNPTLQNNDEQRPERFESDTEKIIHRHLQNKDDVITEEDIRNVRVGLTPTSAEREREEEDVTETIDEEVNTPEDGQDPDQTDDPVTPWDTVQR